MAQNTVYRVVSEINARIKKEICYETIKKLSEPNLMDEFTNCKSVKSLMKQEDCFIHTLLSECELDNRKIIYLKEALLQRYIPKCIPSGTKGVIRGNKFNQIVKEKLVTMNFDEEKFEICFEKNCLQHSTAEIPDWYIRDVSSGRTLIGMNQTDLWGGGHQSNRGSKYIHGNTPTVDKKIICVVCNEIQLKTTKSKTYKLFSEGFTNDTLCYPNGIERIIKDFFNHYK